MAGSRVTNGQLLADIDSARQEIAEVQRKLSHTPRRRTVYSLALAVVVSLATAGGGIWYYVDNNHERCVAGNIARGNIRTIVEQSMIQNAESIIAIAGSEADPERIEQYREQVRNDAAKVVSRLDDMDC